MIFCYKGEHFNSRRKVFITDYVVTHGCFATFRNNKMLSPNTPSAIDIDTVVSYKKMMNEYLERTRIAHNNMHEYILSLSITEKSIKNVIRSNMNYGFNEEFGYFDTTGTASGLNSEIIKNKALLELIEKNEAMIFWYKGIGKKIKFTHELNLLVESIGFISEEVLIYATCNIINIETIIVILVDKNVIVATGVSCHVNEYTGLVSALREAKLMESIHQEYRLNIYNKILTEKEQTESILYLREITSGMKKISLNDLDNSDKEIKLPSWLCDLNYSVLNIKEFQDFITIRCYSRDLFNCVCQKKRTSMSNSKRVLDIFKISVEELSLKPECIII